MDPATLHSTTDHICFEFERIGRGASGEVYLGRHKRQGTAVAMKVFNGLSKISDEREVEILKRLEHENIIKLIGVDVDKTTKKSVLILEYANRGTLLDILDRPENAYGLGEEQFVDLLKQLGRGLAYLWTQNVTHRDIKPGNILVSSNSSGVLTYKIADFGSAKQLEGPHDTFASMHGTQEYMTPKLYERAILRKPVFYVFDKSIDLWALGVTLYQAATARLPFVNLRGRDDKTSMHALLKERGKDDISGIQEANGNRYSKELPPTCKLSTYVRRKLETLFRTLFNPDVNAQAGCTNFVDIIDRITTKKSLYAVQAGTGKGEIIYVKSLEFLKKEIKKILRIPENQQYFVVGLNREITTTITNLSFSRESPLIIFQHPAKPVGVYKQMMPTLPKCPTRDDNTTVNDDVEFAREILHIQQYYLDILENIIDKSRLLIRCADGRCVKDEIESLTTMNNSLKTELELCRMFSYHTRTMNETLLQNTNLTSMKDKIEQNVTGIRQFEQVFEMYDRERERYSQWKEPQPKYLHETHYKTLERAILQGTKPCERAMFDTRKFYGEFYKNKDLEMSENLKQIHLKKKRVIFQDCQNLELIVAKYQNWLSDVSKAVADALREQTDCQQQIDDARTHFKNLFSNMNSTKRNVQKMFAEINATVVESLSKLSSSSRT